MGLNGISCPADFKNKAVKRKTIKTLFAAGMPDLFRYITGIIKDYYPGLSLHMLN
jgi:hypothetical protein